MFVAYLILGVVVGSQYALFAAGLTLVFGTSRVLNFAHGVLFVIGGYTLSVLTEHGLSSVALGVILAAMLGGMINATILELGLTPIRSRTEDYVTTALVTVGTVSIVISGIVWIFGEVPRQILVDSSVIFYLADVPVTNITLFTIVSAPILMMSLAFVIKRTKFGLLLRAVAGSRSNSELQGINAVVLMRQSVLISGMLAAFAGALYAASASNISLEVGSLLMIKGIAIVIVGGMGSVGGAVLVAYLVAIGETFAAGYLGSSWQEVVVLSLLLIVLAVRPSGLFGTSELVRF